MTPPADLEGQKGKQPANDNGQESWKSKQGPRKRVSQACDKCRSRKDKCDGKKPSCSTCTTNSRTCSYEANVKKRGLPEGYVRGMEKLWGLAVRKVNDIEDDLLSALGGGSEEDPLDLWNDESNSESCVETWRKSRIFQGLERLLSSMELGPIAEKRKLVNSEIPPSKRFGLSSISQTSKEDIPPLSGHSDRAFDIRQSLSVQNTIGDSSFDKYHGSKPDIQMPLSQPPIDPPSPNNTYESILTPSNHLTTVCNSTVATSNTPSLPSETWHLLDVYFSYTNSWLPIIEKHDLLRISYQYSQNRGMLASGDHAALWAAIAYAKFQHRAINNIPRALGSVGEMVWTAERMYAQARSLIPGEEGLFDLGHVQALLILTLANIGMGHTSRAWLLIGQAVRSAIDLQLDQPLEHMLASSKAKSRAKHVFLGCFVLDTMIAARLGRHPYLRVEDIDAVGLVDEDGVEEWDPWRDCLNVSRRTAGNSRVPASIPSTFNRLVQVLRILNEVTCMSKNTRGANILRTSASLLGKLQAWSRINPMELDQDLTLLPHQYHLRTAYFTTLAVSQLLPICQQESVNLEPCAASARNITGLINHHSKKFGLLIVPPTYEYYMKTAYDVINSVQSSIDNTHVMLNDWKWSLDNCLETVEPAWPVFEAFKSSVTYQSISHPRRQSEVAFDLISGSTQGETPMSSKTPQSLASYDTMSQYSPQAFGSQTVSESSRPARGTTPPSSHPTQPFGQPSGHGLLQNPLNIYANAQFTISALGNTNPTPAVKDVIGSQFPTSGQTIAMPPQSRRSLHHSVSINSDVDMSDPLLNELMRLDATKWTGNWDQSLVNLGFTDRDNNDQDFYAFCQEPDPLRPNDVFQQLVANSNAEATDFFDSSAFGGMDMGMGNFAGFCFGIGDEIEGIEAGQILQSLSNAGN